MRGSAIIPCLIKRSE